MCVHFPKKVCKKCIFFTVYIFNKNVSRFSVLDPDSLNPMRIQYEALFLDKNITKLYTVYSNTWKGCPLFRLQKPQAL
jgi:hypothetical protein